jgi:hypothetical protein
MTFQEGFELLRKRSKAPIETDRKQGGIFLLQR